MPLLRRILKYTPAVVFGLLVVAWVVSWFGLAAVRVRMSQCDIVVGSGYGAVGWVFIHARAQPDLPLGCQFHVYEFSQLVLPNFGSCRMGFTGLGGACAVTMLIPHACMLAAILPIAVGCCTGLRFRLWHYLAYIALVAVELAYYLRWQE